MLEGEALINLADQLFFQINMTSMNKTLTMHTCTEEPNSSVLVALTIVPLLTLSAFVVVLTALALKRYANHSIH